MDKHVEDILKKYHEKDISEEEEMNNIFLNINKNIRKKKYRKKKIQFFKKFLIWKKNIKMNCEFFMLML